MTPFSAELTYSALQPNMFWAWFVRTLEQFIIIFVRTVSERPLNCGVVVAGRNPFYRDLTFVCAFIAGSSSRRQKLLENPLNLNSLNSSCSKAEGRICQLTRRLCRNGLRVWHAIWVAEQGDWVVVKSLYEFTGIFIMHCMSFFRITVFTGIYMLKSDLKMMICVLGNIL